MKRFHVQLHVSGLAGMKARAVAADMALLDEGDTTCCCARSEKQWVTHPGGIAREQFQTLAGSASCPVVEPPASSGCCG